MPKNVKVSNAVFRALMEESRDRKTTIKDVADSILEEAFDISDTEEEEEEEELKDNDN
jgi:hypothetical protein